jgi:DNA replication and repair protein RecF
MFLRKLTLINFKNYRESTIEFNSAVNCFTGKNGSGKTNLLDALYYLSMTKSYFHSADSHNILHGEQMFIIQGEFEREGAVESVMCSVRHGLKKQFTRNGEDYERLSDHIGAFPVVMIAPTDQQLITEGSEVRRKFIDSIISQYDHVYLENLIRYHQILLQRNALLKQGAAKGFIDWNLFNVWDEQLLFYGNQIFEKRHEFVVGFEPYFNKLFNFISGNNEPAGITYESKLNDTSFAELLFESRSKDSDMQYTTTGIHKDDLSLLLKGFPVKKYASQGQQKSLVIALKLAQFNYLCSLGFSKPIVLLDDIFDKLDEGRVSRLMELVSNDEFGQLFLTDTHKNRVKDVFSSIQTPFRLFNVDNGIAVPFESEFTT